MNTKLDSVSIALIVILALLFSGLLIAKITFLTRTVKGELHYINMEIRRSSGREKKYWKKEKRRLWLHILFGRY